MTHLLTDPGPTTRPPRERRGVLPALAALLVVLTILGGLGWGGLRLLGGMSDEQTADYPGPGTGEVVVQVREGETASAIGATLAEAGVVASPSAFRQAAARDERSRSLQPGVYRLQRQMPAAEALALLLDPTSRIRGRVTIPEGSTVARTLDLLAQGSDVPLADLQAAARAPQQLGVPAYARGLEGYLFPATYDVEPGTTAVELLSQLVARFQRSADAAGLESAAARLGRSPGELVIIASLVEAEAGVEGDFGKVARVAYNRLQRDMPLQFDSTLTYALGKQALQLTQSDLESPSPYNTRNRTGLPPTAIENPGDRALRAAVEPPEGDWLYFVKIDRAGNSLFTADYDEFVRAKQKAQAEGVY